MTFLPIVERELRVSSRHQLTYWSRPIAALLALTIFVAIMVIFHFARGPASMAGQIVFSILSWLGFAYASLVGVFLTSDSLSEEKRDGTLGLLFLTDLRGHDVVLGKLLSHSLLGFYALVAALPIMGISLLLGGVTGIWFVRSLLVIGNSLFLSLAVGMFVSSISREVTKAMTTTLALILILLVGLPWIDFALAHWDQTKFKTICGLVSPSHLFALNESMWPHDFWMQLGLQHAMAWMFLGLACVFVRRTWKDKTREGGRSGFKLNKWWTYGTPKGRRRVREILMARDPFRWLSARDIGASRFITLVLFFCLGQLTYNSYYYFGTNPFQVGGVSVLFLALLLVLWIPIRASSFFLDARRSGALELVLVTPATPEDIVRGQWRTLLRLFSAPILFLVGIILVSNFQWVLAYAANGGVEQFDSYVTSEYVNMAMGIVYVVANALALAWFGMWMGVTSRKTSMAVLKTVCVICVGAYLVEIFGMIMIEVLPRVLIFRAIISSYPQWLPLVFIAMADLVKCVFFIVWSRKRLLTRLRERAAMESSPKKIPSRFRMTAHPAVAPGSPVA